MNLRLKTALVACLLIPLQLLAGDGIDNNGKCPSDLPRDTDCPHAQLMTLGESGVAKGDGIDNNRNEECQRNPTLPICQEFLFRAIQANSGETTDYRLKEVVISCVPDTASPDLSNEFLPGQVRLDRLNGFNKTGDLMTLQGRFSEIHCQSLSQQCDLNSRSVECVRYKQAGQVTMSFSENLVKNLVLSEDPQLLSFSENSPDVVLEIDGRTYGTITGCYGQAGEEGYMVGCMIDWQDGLFLNVSSVLVRTKN